MTDTSESSETDNHKTRGAKLPPKKGIMNTKESTVNRLCKLMRPEVQADPSEFHDDPDLQDQAELDRMNLIMDFIDQFKNERTNEK